MHEFLISSQVVGCASTILIGMNLSENILSLDGFLLAQMADRTCLDFPFDLNSNHLLN